MEILNNMVSVDALWQSIYASLSKIHKTTGMSLWKEILSSSCSCDKVSVQHRSPFLAMKKQLVWRASFSRHSWESVGDYHLSLTLGKTARWEKQRYIGTSLQILSAKVLSERLQSWMDFVCGPGSSCALEKWYFCEVFVWWSDHPLSISYGVYHECHIFISFRNEGLLGDWWGRRQEGRERRKGGACLVFLQGWTNTCFKSR